MGGAVAAGHPLTAEAGARVLAAGGNAVDACIAAATVAWVAESPLTGPGAGGFMLVHRALAGHDVVLDFFVAVPGRGSPVARAAAMDVVDVPFGAGDTTQAFRVGAASCAVPGAVAGLAEAHRLFGSMPWPSLLAPAIAVARGGVELSGPQALLHEVLDAVLRRDPEGRRVYGGPARLARGDRVVMDELATTLETVAEEGAGAFYRGTLARRVVEVVRAGGGLFTERDLAEYRVVRRRPVRARYRAHELVANPPPSSGGILVAHALALLDRLGPGGGPGSPEATARMIEVARATARARRKGFVRGLRRGGLAASLLDPASLDGAAAAILGGEPAAAPDPVGLPSTTHVSVVDGQGNAASMSSSTGCGSGVFVPGTGIQLNNMLGEADLNPSGRPGRPGARLTSMMAPTLLLDRGRPRLVLGSAGSERLRGAIVQTVVNVLDHGLPLADAIERPRVHADGDEVHCEGGLDAGALDCLEALGYGLVRWPGPARNLYFGGVAAVGERPDGLLEAAGDSRRGGAGVVAG